MAAGDTKKTSQLGIATTLNANDRVVVLTNPAASAQTQTITVNNFGRAIASNGIPIANATQLGVIKIGDNLTIAANGVLTGPFSGTFGITETTAAQYTVTDSDTVIFASPGSVGYDITVVLPIGGAVEGREVFVKNINSGGYKVRVTTTNGLDYGTPLLEDPVTGRLAVNYDLLVQGQGETWIHNGTLWRHTATQRSAPIFFTEGNTYHQVVVQNASDGQDASGDFVVYNNIGNYLNGTGPYIDMGINSSNYSNTVYSINRQNDAYLYVDNNGNPGGNLTIGTAQDKSIIFHANGTTTDNKVLTVNSTFVTVNVGIVGTTFSGTANNASYLSTKTEANLNVNNATTANTANNASYLGTIAAASYVQNTDSRTLSGNIAFTGANVTVDGYLVGYRNIPQNFTNTSFTLALTDVGKHILTQNSGSSTQTITVPNNESVAYSTGAEISIVVESAGTVAVANGVGVTMYLAGNSTAKSTITLNTYSISTLLKIGTDTWIVSGTGAS